MRVRHYSPEEAHYIAEPKIVDVLSATLTLGLLQDRRSYSFPRTPGLQEASQQSEMEGKMNSPNDAKQVVMSCVKAINEEDFKKARQYVSDDISFVGAMGSRQGADVYFKDMERMRLKYNVKKVFTDANDVCLFYDLTISGTTIFGCAWYQVADGKIRSLKVVFDPRPILEARSRQEKSA
jgi:hypothetical protein